MLFRRGKAKITRQDAFADLFSTLGELYESASWMKPDWRTLWERRRENDLPPKYHFDDEIAANAAHDMRFATRLLQRYRWKSKVQPLFDRVDEPAWSSFRTKADALSMVLARTAEDHRDRLLEDERDWINNAIEQFDDATRRRRTGENDNRNLATAVAEGTYQPLFVAIQLSDRLIERLRYEAEQRR